MLHINIPNRTINHHDSLRSTDNTRREAVNRITEDIEEWLITEAKAGTNWTINKRAETQIQRNGVDCGVHALIEIERIMKKEWQQRTEKEIAEFRIEIAKRILSSNNTGRTTGNTVINIGGVNRVINLMLEQDESIFGKENTITIWDDEIQDEQAPKIWENRNKRGKERQIEIQKEILQLEKGVLEKKKLWKNNWRPQLLHTRTVRWEGIEATIMDFGMFIAERPTWEELTMLENDHLEKGNRCLFVHSRAPPIFCTSNYCF